ncbi:MAG: sigma-54-dependent Fis family transcriptional regulator, partial [Deltaproteobacteria bacterium]|nr:sigma-54-dependent Fis family transcriptional regulator [Deltaproteobacteria bacterium]
MGGTRAIPVDVRIIAATSRDLDRTVRESLFREDLYYRLNVVPIILPPLRERREDIVPLGLHFLRRFSLETKKSFTEISQEAQQRLLAYDWPGNVRELANVSERAVVMGQGLKLTPEDLPSQMMAARAGTRDDGISYRKVMEDYRREVIL